VTLRGWTFVVGTSKWKLPMTVGQSKGSERKTKILFGIDISDPRWTARGYIHFTRLNDFCLQIARCHGDSVERTDGSFEGFGSEMKFLKRIILNGFCKTLIVDYQ
jgi:hypothetical protein